MRRDWVTSFWFLSFAIHRALQLVYLLQNFKMAILVTVQWVKKEDKS